MNRRNFIKAAIIFTAIPTLPFKLEEAKAIQTREYGKMSLIDVNGDLINVWELPEAFLTQEISKFTFENESTTRVVKALEIRHPRISYGEPRLRTFERPLYLVSDDTLSIQYNLHLNW